MACLGSSWLCARVEKLYQFVHFAQIRRKISITCLKSPRADIGRPTINNTFIQQHCQQTTNTWECRVGVTRTMSSMQTILPGTLQEYQVDPYRLIDDDLKLVLDSIKMEISGNTPYKELQSLGLYYFRVEGKAMRPMLTILMSRAINYTKERNDILDSQRKVAMYIEMIHSSSLIHDDVLDSADFRRGKPSANVLWGVRQVTMASDYIMSLASMLIAELGNNDVSVVLTHSLTDLVLGELMQLVCKDTPNERFAHYLIKNYRKTASLIANVLKSVAILAEADTELQEVAFEYGRNIGLAFQLVDDVLDYVASTSALGKPTGQDLKLGLATAPVLFACEQYPELNRMIERRFEDPGDVERAFDLVHKSQGLEQAKFLAKKYIMEAMRLTQSLADSPYQKGLQAVCEFIDNRMKPKNV